MCVISFSLSSGGEDITMCVIGFSGGNTVHSVKGGVLRRTLPVTASETRPSLS